MTAEEYFGDWLSVIDEKELKGVLSKLNALKNVCPNKKDIFKVFNVTPYRSLKAVILCQDPYPQKGVATGIALANKVNTPLSPSLEILKEAVINFDIPHNFTNFDPTLESWAKQGILLLNSALTVEANLPGSHTLIWKPFISKLLYNISSRNSGLVYILLGKQAQSFEPYIVGFPDKIIKEKHPAYYYRNKLRMPNYPFEYLVKSIKNNYNIKLKLYEEDYFDRD